MEPHVIPILELREATYPPRAGHTVFFDWPPDVSVPMDDLTVVDAEEAQAPEAIERVRTLYRPLRGWKVTQWAIGAVRREDGLFRLAVVAHQIRTRRVRRVRRGKS